MILITGNTGYIGMVMTRLLKKHAYNIIGLDNNYYRGCEFQYTDIHPYKQIVKDIRDISTKDLEGITAIIHLSALSNDPLGEINPSLTNEINSKASIKLAKLAKSMGIQRFIFSSSCSLYGIANKEELITEESQFNPITTYAKTKVEAEKEISKLADNHFHPTFMRNATAYGVSPALRLDLVVNNLVAWAYLTGEVKIMSDGTPWRPIVHVEDISKAFLAVLEAPVDKIHNQAFNVGINNENYQIKDIARSVEKIIPDCRVQILNKTGPDERTYRVNFLKIRKILPQFKPEWNMIKGIEELYQTYKKYGLTQKDFQSQKYFRIRWIKYLIEQKKIDENFKWRQSVK